ncbi:hypothetical protein DY000_02059340, partial [Brassica cretica]
MATFELYRRSTIGMCLTENLDEMDERKLVFDVLVLAGRGWTEWRAQIASFELDGSDESRLSTQVKSKVTIKGHLHTYRFCDNVWTFILQCSRVKTVKR